MKAVWKFPLVIEGRQSVSMPAGATILHVGLQGDTPYLWALVDSEEPMTERTILVASTGYEITIPGGDVKYLGSFFVGDDARFAFHVFENIDAYYH